MKKIIIATGSRADYGLLKELIKLFQKNKKIKTYVLATGSHLAKGPANSLKNIRADGIKNIITLDMQLKGDRPLDICNSLGTETKKAATILKKYQPDLIICLGDRFELWPITMSATIFTIPVAHIHGGESTEGVIDEAIRHSVTKMSHIHFCTHKKYAKRIKQMGENPKNVHTVGAPGLDRITSIKKLSRTELEDKLKVRFSNKNILCTFHPVTLSESETNNEIKNLCQAIKKLTQENDFTFFITLPNVDTFSHNILKQWNLLKKQSPQKVFLFSNLGDLNYISMMKNVDLVLGNSSSGIIEAPFLGKAVVNIGNRQKGRLSSQHILHSNGEYGDLIKKIRSALKPNFQKKVTKFKSIHGNGKASKKIYQKLLKVDWSKLIDKRFYDKKIK
jgi:UDP-hydrolysing UDP-N-acetyl-D-glucosamine 2-epimerase